MQLHRGDSIAVGRAVVHEPQGQWSNSQFLLVSRCPCTVWKQISPKGLLKYIIIERPPTGGLLFNPHLYDMLGIF